MQLRHILRIACLLFAVMLYSSAVQAQSTSDIAKAEAAMEAAANDFDAARYADAAQQFQTLAGPDQKKALEWYFLAQFLGKMGDKGGAKAAYEKSLKEQTSGPMADMVRAVLATFPLQECADCPEMVVIPAGTHVMFGDGYNQEVVNVSKFALSKTPVTQAQWRAIMGNNPSHFPNCGDTCPIENVTWNEAQDYIRKLSSRTGKTYRLPSEAEWEYACMAGQNTSFCGGDDIDAIAWYRGNSNNTTHPVATKQPNGYGLYDMTGNVWEWMKDCWQADCNVGHVLRGGSWGGSPGVLSSGRHLKGATTVRGSDSGFRVARAAP